MSGIGLRGGPTQDEILAIALSKLDLRKGDTFADIGCGTGKVSIAASTLVGKVYAIDKRPEAINHAQLLAKKSGTKNITFFVGEAMEFLSGIERLDCAFVGGSGQLEDVLELLAQKVDRMIVVNAVLIHTVDIAIATLIRLGIFKEAFHVQVSRSHEVAGRIMFKPIDPVYIIVGGRGIRSSG